MVKLITILLVSALMLSPTLGQQNIESERLFNSTIPYSPLPDYRSIYEEVLLSKREDMPVYHQIKLLEYFAAILPAIKYEAYVHREYLAIQTFGEAEVISYELTQFMLSDPNDYSIDEYRFYERRILTDASNSVDRIQKVLPTLEAIAEKRLRDGLKNEYQ
ncbi:hypothetical protein [Vibrio owensii]|uniref:hypothetical protein n=1 Tax=Vibrio owensii TaxID=696485 RepID=UPI0040677066